MVVGIVGHALAVVGRDDIMRFACDSEVGEGVGQNDQDRNGSKEFRRQTMHCVPEEEDNGAGEESEKDDLRRLTF